MFTVIFIYFDDWFLFFVFIFYEFSLLTYFNFDSFWIECHHSKKEKKENVRIRCQYKKKNKKKTLSWPRSAIAHDALRRVDTRSLALMSTWRRV